MSGADPSGALAGRRVLITGAASGIGAATARRAAAEGARALVLSDLDAPGLETLAAALPGSPEIHAAAFDVADPAAWPAFADAIRARFDGVDAAVVNAGVGGATGPIADVAFDDWRRVLGVNLDGAFLTLQTAVRLMAGGTGGAIVAVASAAGIKSYPSAGAYGASKAALIHLARTAAAETAQAGIRVNVVAPGGVSTPLWGKQAFFKDLVAQTGGEDAAMAAMAAAAPLGRFAEADEIAGQIVFLLSDAAATVTGAVLTADGGVTL